MNLKILLPSQVFADLHGVARVVAETSQGSFGFLPQRLDCVAALVPGILSYASSAGGDVYVAVDEGVLVKCGPNLLVSVRNAVSGKDLSQLREVVEQDFLRLDQQQKEARSVMEKMESNLLRRMAIFANGG